MNIRRLCNHFDQLHSLLCSTKTPFDIIGFIETKQTVDKDFLTNVNIDGYHLYTQPTKRSCGGTAICVKKSLDCKVLSDLNALEDEFETLWVEINTGSKCKNIICCAYRHPDTDAGKFMEHIEHTLSKIDKNKVICILEDFNINLLNYETRSDTNNFLNSMISHYLFLHVLQRTRVTDHSATVIDNIFTNATDFETVSGNILNRIADHFSQFLILWKLYFTHKDNAFYQYDYLNFDKDKFAADFSKINWLEESHSSNVSEKFFNFHNKVSNCVKQHVTLVKLSRKKISLHSKPWINPRIEHLMAKRDKYLWKFNCTKSLDMEYLYKKFRNKVVSEIRKSKNDYYSQYFSRNKSNMKMLWSGICSIINVKTNVGISISSLNQNGVKVEEPKK